MKEPIEDGREWISVSITHEPEAPRERRHTAETHMWHALRVWFRRARTWKASARAKYAVNRRLRDELAIARDRILELEQERDFAMHDGAAQAWEAAAYLARTRLPLDAIASQAAGNARALRDRREKS